MGLDPQKCREFLALRYLPPSAIITRLYNIPGECFSSTLHYQYYKRYIVPKLSQLGREYYVNGEKYVYNLEIGLGSEYVVLGFERKNYRRNYRGEYVERWSTRRYYLLGFESTGKVFVNGTEFIGIPEDCVETYGASRVTVGFVADEQVKQYLNYYKDLDTAEEITIEDTGRYRVQGEVVLRVETTLTNEEIFKDWLLSRLRNSLSDYATLLTCDRVALRLFELGFSPSYRFRGSSCELVLEGAIRRYDNVAEKVTALIRELCSAFECEEIHYDIARAGLRVYGLPTVVVDISTEPGGFGNPYANVVLRFARIRDCEDSYPICAELVNDLKKQVEELPRGSYNFALGNHLVTVENAYSLNTIYMPLIQPLYLPARPVRVDLNMYYVDPKTRIKLSHTEHGTVSIRFAKPFLVSFGTTEVSSEYHQELNRVALSLIYEKHKPFLPSTL